MVNTNGYRRGTRYLFSRPFKKHGTEHLSTYMTVYKVGDIVGRERVMAPSTRACPTSSTTERPGESSTLLRELWALLSTSKLEHVKHSRCREDFLKRVKANELKRKQAKERGEKVVCKRLPEEPRLGHFVRTGGKEPELVEPIPYEFVA
ncbi:60S ribosomal protein L21 [Geodia barretti]|uniref:60S ribosomal protein L21 n=1 Tax=Geodia barretti TaxID=519541 RepID=A0AA35RV37_GEOBA|nr:60S ribosomal protein L21 [Geodia barretti]